MYNIHIYTNIHNCCKCQNSHFTYFVLTEVVMAEV